MTSQEEILKKAIEKAVENGYKFPYAGGWRRKGYPRLAEEEITWIIFSHQFAKAFWGEMNYEKECPYNCGYVREVDAWQFHLQQLVLEENPINYLKKFL